MTISGIQISNYKSFYESSWTPFTPGFNLIVGQNNVGKTALVEALSLNVSPHPHRSLLTIEERNTALNQESKVSISVTFALEIGEIENLLKQHGDDFSIPFQSDEGVEKALDRFRAVFYYKGHLTCSLLDNGTLYAFLEEYENQKFREEVHKGIQVKFDLQRLERANDGFPPYDRASNSSYAAILASKLRSRVYRFKAERLNVGECIIGTSDELLPNAANLPEVLHVLQTQFPKRFAKLTEYLTTIFPQITQITTPLISNQQSIESKILVWNHDPDTNRDDLAVPLSESGTGISQVLAMLYVVVSAEQPRTIIIDEPQSFLHPEAVRKLFEIFKRYYSHHQFIVTTHSPTVVTATNPRTLLLLRKPEFTTITETIEVSEVDKLRHFLLEIGARLSDVFGADDILWVEGATEEACFPLIQEELLSLRLLGTQIIAVQSTGDFDRKERSKTIFEIYEKLSQGRGLLPPAIGFIFDREDRSPEQRANLQRQSQGKVSFLNRKMYENYLLHLEAISAVLSESDPSGKTSVSSQDVEQWLQSNGQDRKYLSKSCNAIPQSMEWVENVHGAYILKDLFLALSENRVSYDKVTHGIALTEWLISNAPSSLDEVAGLIKKALEPKQV